MSNNQEPTNIKSGKTNLRKKRGWIIAAGILVLFSCLIIFNYKLAQIGYYYIFKADHFNIGDKVYESQSIYDIPNSTALGAYRLIRPLTQKDVDNMEIDPYKKEILRKGIDTTLKPYIKTFMIYFDKSDMAKYKSALVGTFVETGFFNATDVNQKEYFDIFYAIKPNRKVFHEDPLYKFDLPKNYTLADSNIYVAPSTVANKELPIYFNQ